jgi:peptidoglycan/xylan/chitin deacetylase (PgdA/CDA1 family)
VSIVCYHAIDPAWHSPISVEPGTFDRHMAWLASHRRVVSLRVATRVMDAHGRLPRGIAAVTFDDGFASVHEHAMPTLLREGLEATIFLVAGTLDGEGAPIDWIKDALAPRRALSPANVLELRDAGFEIGSHSYAHHDLTTLLDGEIVSDLRRSREVLEDLIEGPVTLLAYPGGRHDERVRRAARTAGFENGYAMANTELPALPHAIPRVGVHRGQGTATLYAKTSPWFWRMRTSPLQPYIARLTGLRRPGREEW